MVYICMYVFSKKTNIYIASVYTIFVKYYIGIHIYLCINIQETGRERFLI